ncbi:hypothetical protein DFR50_1055 [Roseiarcus fermentans]|uniref:Uncharacterized protein n=1 Tax=Roseiarcus fermentans TaxID=1473586 RepID=A0A366FNT9_9HYPH|nr:hypothetical protein [Roseiarcus fermentans]RBP16364.1 hypothetical protein DFR50_1055 [Roseiarcus fermentans]
MGFVVRTIFWLGLVYSQMPLDFGSLVSDGSAGLMGANPLADCVRGATDACRHRIADLHKALDAAVALGLIDPGAAAVGPAVASDARPSRRLEPGRSN